MRPRSKQTEVGIIPVDWDIGLIGDYATKVGSGITPTGGRRVYRDSGRPFVRSQNVGWGKMLLDDIAFINEEMHAKFSETEIRPDDVLLNITGASIGRSAVADVRIAGGNVNQHVCIIRTQPEQMNARFLNLVLLSSVGQRQIDSFQAGGNREGLNFSQVRSIKVPLPKSESEQSAIAGVLSDVDALLSSLDAVIAKKRDIKQAAIQQLLTGKTRLPGFEGEWVAKRLGDLGRCLRGVSYRGDVDLSPHDTDQTKRLLRSNNVQDAVIVTTDVQFVDSNRVSEQQILLEGDVLICMANGSKALVGKAGYFDVVDGFDYTFGAFMGVFRVAQGLTDKRFAFYQFQTSRYREYIKNLLAGSSINNLTPSSIESLVFKFPSVEEQIAIAEVLSDMDAELTALEARRDKTNLLKQGMMQDLLTGKTRLV